MVGLDIGDLSNRVLTDFEIGGSSAEVSVGQEDRVVLVSGVHVVVTAADPVKGEVCSSPLCFIRIVWTFQLCLLRLELACSLVQSRESH